MMKLCPSHCPQVFGNSRGDSSCHSLNHPQQEHIIHEMIDSSGCYWCIMNILQFEETEPTPRGEIKQKEKKKKKKKNKSEKKKSRTKKSRRKRLQRIMGKSPKEKKSSSLLRTHSLTVSVVCTVVCSL
ncbi:uncharacterized protein BP01DRAFT_181996 [Aspergillus saccharolyticus JOP 1030-1]|uniref:Uncharacterized protein n=1 Tax=Aspergillus saccharolyticus JOP 1030-1 TaxID=1450539 RepID=A0A318Z296_9EURO|nr:hypothetical protein BP01DRAFT_181996 [Aspergillus saccharolyticus JOP 1030-1]PYH41186.1 hypothetical protein BP01DRAFT_181996 [Aspergillus saccharolyticus JOP 1030-1]